MEIHVKVAGFILIMLALVHVIFPRYFDWKNDLSTLSLINRQMMYVHTFFIALCVMLMGVLSITSAAELTDTVLGKRISLGLGIFWAFRFFIQFFGYSSLLWKGKRFETVIHIIFSFLWLYISSVFLYACWANKTT